METSITTSIIDYSSQLNQISANQSDTNYIGLGIIIALGVVIGILIIRMAWKK